MRPEIKTDGQSEDLSLFPEAQKFDVMGDFIKEVPVEDKRSNTDYSQE